jgi:hypothetical protein
VDGKNPSYASESDAIALGGERIVPNPNSSGDFSWVIPEGVQYVSGQTSISDPFHVASDTLVVIARSDDPIAGMVRYGVGLHGEGLGFYLASGSAHSSD